MDPLKKLGQRKNLFEIPFYVWGQMEEDLPRMPRRNFIFLAKNKQINKQH